MLLVLNRLANTIGQIISSSTWCIVAILTTVLQPFLAYISAQQIASLGLDATPDLYPELAQAIPPVDYLGFDATFLGLVPMVVLGAVLGANDYQNHRLRNLFLTQSNRSQVFMVKTIALIVTSLALSLISIYLTILTTHVGLGSLGLNLIRLSPIAWQYIGYTGFYWLMLTVLSFGLAMLSKNVILPLFVLIPQIYNLGDFLAERWDWATYLPVAAGNGLLATPTDLIPQTISEGVIVLFTWPFLMMIIAYVRFIKQDVGGTY